ncbi:DUF2752 domain-containing protein [Ruminiclostridium cellulolyticum]|uniref:DUF2752 domain-containing protein n=1 Tax=Ruminiclostridium cellulolyticum (strain ATCC 35319 / DSM 5812 / JCM 6584 / H10) TaxID=394503 RepID=B8I2S8_RUMCH|nr:DUF2752 domain-containing protein [Ruminiclostridium cellulolyticum]ACL76071.1 hypothetical protein Ccel_1720 [Ruminiclostridium cellulolyticum H10]
MTNNLKWKKAAVCIFPLAIIIIAYFLRNQLIYLGTLFPSCPSYTYLNIYCPGCGNTRSVQHLLKGDILGSIRFNPIPLLGIILSILAYIELITYVFGRHRKIFPRNRTFWWTLVVISSVYFVVRNFIRPF